MAFNRTNFVHNPLDHTKPSIRLVELQPQLSEDGLVQCNLFHATIDAEYTCLSYMWGPESPTAAILINGKEFSVRKNLLDFLKMAITHTSVVTRVFWIDAVCIDQENNTERQHQVLQMGDIYEKAQEVIVWLGICDVPIPPWVLEPPRRVLPGKHSRLLKHHRPFDLRRAYRAGLDRYLYDNPYWNRAWITQEIKLARICTVFLDSTSMPLDDVIEFYWGCVPFTNIQCTTFNPRLRPIDRTFYSRYDRPLIDLLATFEDRKCSIPQDRIFSLLSFCSERSAIVVDYELPRLDLMLNVLNAFPDTLCICSVNVVGRALELPGLASSEVKLQQQILWLSFDLRPGDRSFWNEHDPSVPRMCILGVDLSSINTGYAAWDEEKIWKATFRLRDSVEHVIYWGEQCTLNMPVYHNRRGADGQRVEHRVLCRYGDGLHLSTMANSSGKVTLRIALEVFMDIVAGMKHGLCHVAKFGRDWSHNMRLPKVTIGYHGCKGAWKELIRCS